ncbi:hypothetical protein ACHAXR_011905 [Thalassiosira sp. AJA248-18]
MTDRRGSGRGSGGGGGGGGNTDDILTKLMESNNHMSKEMEYLRTRLNAMEMTNQPPPSMSATLPNIGGGAAVGATDNASEQAVAETGDNTTPRRGIKWRDSMDGLDISEHHPVSSSAVANNNAPPMRKIKFRDISPKNNDSSNNNNNQFDQAENDVAQIDNDVDNSSETSSTSSEDAIAFSGWARCFFQARHHRSATQITSGATSTTSQDTYLYLTIHSTSNELRISNTDDRWKPPLIDPPIPLKYFYAVKVPGSHSGAALFLKNDSRRLRKYIFRFEFINRSVHQPPARYIQFIRSGKAAKKTMRGMTNKIKNAFHKMGEERKENMKENKKRAQDAFAAHLGTLDELLRECDEAADRFVECVNTRNEEEEELSRSQREMMGSGGMLMMGDHGRRKRSKPPPPYWGSGFNRPSMNEKNDEDDDDEDDHVDSDSDFSEEDDELYYDDDNDDETFFDKVQVSTEQTLETLFNHIVK